MGTSVGDITKLTEFWPFFWTEMVLAPSWIVALSTPTQRKRPKAGGARRHASRTYFYSCSNASGDSNFAKVWISNHWDLYSSDRKKSSNCAN